MPNLLPVSRVVQVAVQMAPLASQLRNFGAALIVGSSDVIGHVERIRTYSASELDTIATDFGVDAPEYQAAVAFFGQSPQPADVRIGRWVESAAAGLLRGRILTQAEQAITNFTSISSGAFDVTIDGSVVNVTAVDLSAQVNLNGVASQVTAALQSKGECLWNGQQFVIKSATTGATSTVTNVTSTELSQALGLEAGTTAVAGAPAESLEEAFVALLDSTAWYAAILAAPAETDDILGVAALIEAAAPSRVLAVTSQDTQELVSGASTLGSQLSEKAFQHTLCVYSSSSPYAAASVVGRMSTVDFQGSNTTITLKFKQLPGISPEYLTTSQANALQEKNVNVFAAYENDTSILQEGVMSGGWYIDERHGLDWLQNQVETDLWNLLYTSTTKVGQDERGATAIVSTINSSLEIAVRNGLVGPGVWNGDSVGALARGDTLTTGYYVYMVPFDEQSQADREARKAPPVQIAVKLVGAVHSIDVTITVNR